MILGVVGSRTFTNKSLMWNILDKGKSQIDLIVSGGARGADYYAEKYSRDVLNKEPIIYEAEWDNLEAEPCIIKTRKDGSKYNSMAGVNRNKLIVLHSDRIIAFWDGKSPGTKTTIDFAAKHKKPCTVVYYHG